MPPVNSHACDLHSHLVQFSPDFQQAGGDTTEGKMGTPACRVQLLTSCMKPASGWAARAAARRDEGLNLELAAVAMLHRS